jgi:hypothetical protein
MPVPSSRLSFAESLSMVLEAREAALAKALPGTVVSYDDGNSYDPPRPPTALVRPGVHRLVRSENDPNEDEIEILPAIPDVPVMWPRGRGFSFIGSLSAGDPVLLVCCDRDISGWVRTGTPSEPEDARSHSWGHAVAIPGLVSQAYTYEPSDALALASKVDARVDSLQEKLDDLITKYNSHTHPVGTPNTDVPLLVSRTTTLGPLAATNSSIAKVDS